MRIKYWGVPAASALCLVAPLVALTATPTAAAPQPSPPAAASSAINARESSSAFSVAQFRQPDMTYRPGVRWWWSGGAVEIPELIRQIRYLADNGFGYAEINPFDPAPLPGDAAAVADVYSQAFYDKLEAVVAEAERLGVTIDLNMGTGWNANSPFVQVEDSMGNMALGRRTVAGTAITTAPIDVPAIEKSQLYFGVQKRGEWSAVSPFARLQGVLVAELTGQQGRQFGPGSEAAFNIFDDGAKSYQAQLALDPGNSYFVDAAKLVGGKLVLDAATVAAINASGKNYELIGLYVLPTGATGSHEAVPWPVVDHLDGSKTAQYVNEWAGAGRLRHIIDAHDNIRALFNDSYEFNGDSWYNDKLYALAKDASGNGLGYDFTKYLPSVYRSLGATPTFRRLGTPDTFLTYSLDTDERARITYDYNTLVSQKFLEGMAGFKSASNALGLQYRQQAYNPPIDTLEAAKYMDIPESEQPNELKLIQASSAAHLYGRNDVTAEQYTLGNVPFTNTLEMVKVGFDLMATSGVNNFFYHGFNYDYGKGSQQYGENGWAGFPTIGIDVSDDNTLSPYFEQLNTYAARVNYMTQLGRASKDVAVYMPFNTNLAETDVVKTLNTNGYAWDAINDDSIQSDATQVRNGKLRVNGGTMSYDAIIVDVRSLPVATMKRLAELADRGATVVFYGAAPNRQPGYADGDYVTEDAKVAAAATQALAERTASLQTTTAGLLQTLEQSVSPPVTYESDSEVRFNRRTLTDGSELTFLRNIGATQNEITVRVDDRFKQFYWLDQNTGRIYDADVKKGRVTFVLEAGKDQLGRPTAQRSMSIALLASPTGRNVTGKAVSKGLPPALDVVEPDEVTSVQVDSLRVSADNLDGTIGGPVESVTYVDNVLGKWNDPTFHNGALRQVVADGVYTSSVQIGKVKGTYVLDLGEVFTAATVRVNGVDAGKALFEPYEVDITDALRRGTNTIEVTVTPRKMNRYVLEPNGQYNGASRGFQDSGLVGPVSLLRYRG